MINIIEKYEKFLQNEITNFGNIHIANNILFEEGGTNYNSFKNAVNTIKKSIPLAITNKDEKGIYLYNKINIKDSFLYNIEYKIYFDPSNKIHGGYAYNSGYYNNVLDKLCNARFIFNETEFNFPNAVGNEFEYTMWHEIQHAYVQYNVLKKIFCNNKQQNNKMDYQRQVYQNAIQTKDLLHPIQNVFYYANKNEIGSHLNEIIPYIEKNTEINFTNYKNYLTEIPGYYIIKMLKDYLKWYQKQVDLYGEQFKYDFGLKIIELYPNKFSYKNKKITPIKATNKLIKHLANTIVYIEKQFYKILSYILKQCNRKQNFSEWHYYLKIDRNIDFSKNYLELLNEIKNGNS